MKYILPVVTLLIMEDLRKNMYQKVADLLLRPLYCKLKLESVNAHANILMFHVSAINKICKAKTSQTHGQAQLKVSHQLA